MTDSQVRVGGGRQLAYTDIGHPSGPCVFFFHGAPMSRLHLLPLEAPFEGRREVELMRLSDERTAFARCAEHLGADGSGFFVEPFELPEPDGALLADATAEQALTAALVTVSPISTAVSPMPGGMSPKCRTQASRPTSAAIADACGRDDAARVRADRMAVGSARGPEVMR